MLLFPYYNAYGSSYKINKRFVNKYIPNAIKRIKINQKKIENVFKTYLKKKYNIYDDCIYLDVNLLIFQLEMTSISSDIYPWAVNDNNVIIISDHDKMKRDELITILVHEGLHNSILVKRNTRQSNKKLLSSEDEHKCMHILGENSNDYC